MYIQDDIKAKVNDFLSMSHKNMGHALGIAFLSFKKNEVKASMPVNHNTIQPFGILHGGASAALAETIASVGAWLNVDDSKTAVGLEINANHLKAVSRGNTVIGTATPVQRGRQIHVWEVTIRTEDDNLVCVSRCTLMIIDQNQS